MYKIFFSRKFEKDIARCIRRGLDARKLYEVVALLEESGTLPPKYWPHNLSGKYKGVANAI